MYESNNSSRINIRLTPEEKIRIEQLAKMSNLTVKKLIVDSTLNPLQLPGVQSSLIEEHNRTLIGMSKIIDQMKIPTTFKDNIIKEMSKLWIPRAL